MPQEKLWINGDSVRLAQVVSNLLHNAAKYTPSGGEIELDVTALDDRLRIVVSDNGIGIRRENIDQIFELFTQAQRLDSRAPEGLGVGLSLVKSLVELHGGTIEVRSPGIGGGSVFTIELPLNPKLPIVKRRAPHPLKGTTDNPLRILLVDDSVDAVNMMRLLLERLGHSVAVANDSISALALAPALVPHVVLLDIGLPGVDGYEVAREMVKMPELQKTKLVALTGYGQDKDRDQAFASGFSHHFIKPVEIVDLNNLLSSIEAF
jgi:CheY-like chemotaxis protein